MAALIAKVIDKKDDMYLLQDINGMKKQYLKSQLKEEIKQKKLCVVNLTLTKDNRLIATRDKFVGLTCVATINFSGMQEDYVELKKTFTHHLEYLFDFEENSDIESASCESFELAETRKAIHIKLYVVVSFDYAWEFKGNWMHHIDYIWQLNEFPEIKSFHSAKIIDYEVA